MVKIGSDTKMEGIMNGYRKIYKKLKKQCRRDGLRLIEAKLENEKICYAKFENCYLINKNYHKSKNKK